MPIIKNRAFMGVDPGAKGGIVIIYENLKGNQEIEWYSLTDQDDMQIWKQLWWWKSRYDLNFRRVTIERINPGIKGHGKSSMSKLYGSYRALEMCLTIAGFSFESVFSQHWMPVITKTRKGETDSNVWKELLRTRAESLFPNLELWSLQKYVQNSVCDALLLAEYSRRKYNED